MIIMTALHTIAQGYNNYGIGLICAENTFLQHKRREHYEYEYILPYATRLRGAGEIRSAVEYSRRCRPGYRFCKRATCVQYEEPWEPHQRRPVQAAGFEFFRRASPNVVNASCCCSETYGL
jgi:hypothetical protein